MLESWEASTFTGWGEKEEHIKETKKGQWKMRTWKTDVTKTMGF